MLGTALGFTNYCRQCGKQVNGPVCHSSKCFAFHCNICNLSVRGEPFNCETTLLRYTYCTVPTFWLKKHFYRNYHHALHACSLKESLLVVPLCVDSLCVQVALISVCCVVMEDTQATCCGGLPHRLSVLLAADASVWRPADGHNNCSFLCVLCESCFSTGVRLVSAHAHRPTSAGWCVRLRALLAVQLPLEELTASASPFVVDG